MTNAADAAAAPISVKLGNETFTMSPLREEGLGTFLRWLQDRHIQIAARNLSSLEPEDRKDLLAVAHDRATALDLDSPEFMKMMFTIEGAAKLLQIMFSKHHPDITETGILKLLIDHKDDWEVAMSKVNMVNKYEVKKKRVTRKRKVKRKKK